MKLFIALQDCSTEILRYLSLSFFLVGATNACEIVAQPKTQLLELYTSEGCSSCPPADAYFSTLKPSDELVPLAFHVDYWDSLGWPDRFSSAKNSARQRWLASQQKRPAVYTPGFFLNGIEWRKGSTQAPNTQLQPMQIVAVRRGKRVDVMLKSTLPTGATWAAAIAESGLGTEVVSGENSGRKLTHDHVVRVWQSGTANSVSLSVPIDLKPDQARLVAWLEYGATIRSVLSTPLLACGAAK